MSGSTRSYEMARRLVAKGHQVYMVTSDRNGSGEPYHTDEAGIKVIWIPVPYSNTMGRWSRVRAFAQFAWRSARIAASLNGDVVFASSTPLTIAIPGIYASKRNRIPMVFEVRDPWPEMLIGLGAIKDPITVGVARLLERLAYRNSKHIVALSDGMKEIVGSTGYPLERVSVIPNASDLGLFGVSDDQGKAFREQFDWLGDRKLVLYAGTLGFANDVGYLAKVARFVHEIDPEIRFLVIGSGVEEHKVRELSRSLGILDRNFFMLPRIPKQQIPSAFNAATICTVLLRDVESLWTNSSNKFFDALAAGRPVAVNNVGWQSELLTTENAGIVLDPSDHSLAARNLVAALHDEEWLCFASENARRLASTRFNRDDLAEQLEEVLINVVSS